MLCALVLCYLMLSRGVVLCCYVPWFAVLCCAVLCCAVLCYAVFCCVVLCCDLLCCVVLCHIVMRWTLYCGVL